jgi:hypothetical protein
MLGDISPTVNRERMILDGNEEYYAILGAQCVRKGIADICTVKPAWHYTVNRSNFEGLGYATNCINVKSSIMKDNLQEKITMSITRRELQKRRNETDRRKSSLSVTRRSVWVSVSQALYTDRPNLLCTFAL